jgi:predicted Rossmann-fold nucleotide-binding protein
MSHLYCLYIIYQLFRNYSRIICGVCIYVDIPITTGLSHARNVIIARAADALIAVSGGYGTLSEIAIALKLEKPVIGIKTWGNINPNNAFRKPQRAQRRNK